MSINTELYNILLKEASDISDIIGDYENKLKRQKEKLNSVEKQIKKFLPKGYWWTWEINRYRHLKKYSITNVKYSWDGKFYVCIKECSKYKNHDECSYSFEDFLKINTYSTEEKAQKAYYNRICPKCGNAMGDVKTEWCKKCMDKRIIDKEEFEHSHTFYEPNEMSVYTVGYTDELTREYDKGFSGKHFTIKRLDTGEIIKTDNLWISYGKSGNINNLPLIEFLIAW